VLIKATLGAFFPVFGDGNTIIAILVASVGIWLFHFMILKGTQQAAFINQVVTIAKIVPILLFIVILIFAFKLDLFSANFFGGKGYEDASLFDQVRATMLVTVFVFLGIEGASVYSRFAQKRSHVGTATILGFLGVTCLLVLVTLLPYAVLARGDIAGMRQPSMAAVLEAVVGPWGAIFISVGLLVSVLGAYLAWSLICAEVVSVAAKNQDMPKIFATENRNKVPAAALWMTNIIVQLFVISTYWSQDAFTLMLSMTSVMTLIPFLLVALFGYLLVKRRESYETRPEERTTDFVFATLAVIYTLFLLYAAGLKFLVLSAILYGPGTVLYIWTRREQGKPLFTPVEWVIFLVTVVLCIVGIHGLATGSITI
jgi:arginine:ornithine antiporter/lysine permease